MGSQAGRCLRVHEPDHVRLLASRTLSGKMALPVDRLSLALEIDRQWEKIGAVCDILPGSLHMTDARLLFGNAKRQPTVAKLEFAQNKFAVSLGVPRATSFETLFRQEIIKT